MMQATGRTELADTSPTSSQPVSGSGLRIRRLLPARWLSRIGCAALVAATSLASGCHLTRDDESDAWRNDASGTYYEAAATQIEYPNVATPMSDAVLSTSPPMSIASEADIEFEYVSLEHAVHTALANSRVLSDLGGVVLRDGNSATTTFDPAIQELDPRFGVAAALSEFDTSFAASAFVDKNDRALNNQFFGGGTRLLQQDNSVVQAQLSKRAATGTQMSLLNRTEYDSNNAPGNQFRSAWTTWTDLEVRHPLLKGGGTDFLRIAGPSDNPSEINGVVIARLRTDVSLTDFEMAVRDYVSNVENAYWDLYYAYRDLDAKIVARDTALETWRQVRARFQAGQAGGEEDKEAQAREQYFRFQEQVQNALSGKLTDGTRASRIIGGGAFQSGSGVMVAERRLRKLMGLPINAGKLLRPEDEPIEANIAFDWDSVLVEALTRRAELRRQKWLIKQAEQRLVASRNFLLPQLDAIGRYRWRGFGHGLLQGPNSDGDFNNAVENLLDGNFQEWHLGVEVSMPLGNRRAHAGVEYAEMLLAREKAVLGEQEREVVLALSNALAESNRAWSVLATSGDRRAAADKQLAVIRDKFEKDQVEFDVVLDAQRRFLDAETSYYGALVEYTVAIRNVHFEKGSLLDYNEIYLTEDLWPVKAYDDAMRRRANSLPAEWVHGFVTHPTAVSAGAYGQNLMPGDATEWEGSAPTAVPAAAPAGEDAADDAGVSAIPRQLFERGNSPAANLPISNRGDGPVGLSEFDQSAVPGPPTEPASKDLRLEQISVESSGYTDPEFGIAPPR